MREITPLLLLILLFFSADPVIAQKKNTHDEKKPVIPDIISAVPTITNQLHTLLKSVLEREYYREKKNPEKKEVDRTDALQNDDPDVSAIKDNAEGINNIVVLIAELPTNSRDQTLGPVFLRDKKNIFDSGTDMYLEWIGYKINLKFKQKNFPSSDMSLEETVVGSFLYASGTNIGFLTRTYKEDIQFYTNYISEIVVLRWQIWQYFNTGWGLSSRQYFFSKRKAPDNFIMPKDHANIFPHIILDAGKLSEAGIDKITKGIIWSSWVGYGYRSNWDTWGEPGNLQTGDDAKDFWIVSSTITAGFVFMQNHNLVIRMKFKGGIDNDFLSRPRFGGTIDNANLDTVHGTTLDEFRVNDFLLVNTKYGFNLFSRLRLNFFFDYARIIRPDREDHIGMGYGLRIFSIGGMPLWVTHGISRRIYPDPRYEQAVMIMTAAGW